jgi:CRISPR/Cas system-associated protein Csm6
MKKNDLTSFKGILILVLFLSTMTVRAQLSGELVKDYVVKVISLK